MADTAQREQHAALATATSGVVLRSDDARPMYRAVEVVRDAQGRLQLEGKVWHPDLTHARRFGRALARRSAGQRVMVANSAGRVLEDLGVAAPADAREFSWADWQSLEVPPLPALPARALLPGSPVKRVTRALTAAAPSGAPDVEVVLP